MVRVRVRVRLRVRTDTEVLARSQRDPRALGRRRPLKREATVTLGVGVLLLAGIVVCTYLSAKYGVMTNHLAGGPPAKLSSG